MGNRTFEGNLVSGPFLLIRSGVLEVVQENYKSYPIQKLGGPYVVLFVVQADIYDDRTKQGQEYTPVAFIFKIKDLQEATQPKTIPIAR